MMAGPAKGRKARSPLRRPSSASRAASSVRNVVPVLSTRSTGGIFKGGGDMSLVSLPPVATRTHHWLFVRIAAGSISAEARLHRHQTRAVSWKLRQRFSTDVQVLHHQLRR